jgi:hypothetical protein
MPSHKRDPLTEATRLGARFPRVDTSITPHAQHGSVATPTEPQDVMIQAQRDVARGLKDTDCYTRLGKLIPRTRKK